MKFIVCTGDSHTWGQGPAGLLEHFRDPGVQGGELRPAPFSFPLYVNLLREEINARTGSEAFEEEPCRIISGPYRTGRVCGGARFIFRFEGHNNYKIAAVIDGKSQSPLLTAYYEDNGTLTVIPAEPMYLYRAEYYAGPYAVINSGVGSCPSSRYLDVYYHDYVEIYRPAVIAAEAHSINDWLNRLPLCEVKENLKRILTGCPGAFPILLTVAPIDGTTTQPYNEIDYNEYVDASRQAALENGFCLADAHPQVGMHSFSDCWHVNEAGHRIYFETIMKAIEENGLLS